MCALYRLVVCGLLLAASTRAWAVGETVTDIRVQNNVRTQEDAIRALAGLSIGDTLEADTLEIVRERLQTSGLFADVNVFWEPYKDGVRVNIVITDKFPWAPLPTFSRSPGNTSAGLVVAHGNLFGRGKRGIIGGRISTADSGLIAAYQDPSMWGTWLFFDTKTKFQDQTIPEYGNHGNSVAVPLRETKFRSYGFELNLGIAWFRRVRTSVGWNIEKYNARWSRPTGNPDSPGVVPAAAESARRGIAQANLMFDFRAREHAIMYGSALSMNLDMGSPRWGSEDKIDYWKASVTYERGVRILRRHNFIIRANAITGERLPMWSENSAGGSNLRGFLYQQFRGDTQVASQIEYHFPLFSINQLDFRALVFNDVSALWYRNLTPVSGTTYGKRADGRQFLDSDFLSPGFKLTRDVHDSIGGGLRFFLRSVAVPLLGVDYGYGLGEGTWRLILVMGV